MPEDDAFQSTIFTSNRRKGRSVRRNVFRGCINSTTVVSQLVGSGDLTQEHYKVPKLMFLTIEDCRVYGTRASEHCTL